MKGVAMIRSQGTAIAVTVLSLSCYADFANCFVPTSRNTLSLSAASASRRGGMRKKGLPKSAPFLTCVQTSANNEGSVAMLDDDGVPTAQHTSSGLERSEVDVLGCLDYEIEGSNFTVGDVSAEYFDLTKPREPETPLEAPDVKKVLRFAIPAIGVWLCSPLLSLIDTSAVGLLSGTAQQAALNPAVAITDYGSLLVAFIYTATTNLVAAAQENDRGVEGKPQTRKTFIAALQLASFVGIFFGATLGIFSKVMMKTLVGNGAIDPLIFSAALRYVRIRALGMPAAVVIGSAQAACLGMQDIRSPLYVLLAAAVVNFCGDMLFVGSKHPLIGGAAGAAWATVFSQYAALALFLAWLRRKPNESPGAEQNESGALKTKGILGGNFRKRDLLKFPTIETSRQFSPFVVPVTTTAIGRVSGYIAMSHVASSSLGMVDMAAQQILLAFFTCFTPICDSINLTAQSFVPGIFAQKSSQARTAALKQAVQSFVKAGGIMGGALVGAVSCIPLLSKFFTLDAAVLCKVASATPFLVGIFALSGIVCAGEGETTQ